MALADLGIEGAISGRALYDGTLDLHEANRALAIGDDW
jgi:phosphoribosylformimino-5-aminoimidazole carboxamide ribonucleotide (ProFAR) isomerase